MTATNKKIAILSTGDELINGDIVNSNSQYFRQQLVENGMMPGSETLIGDDTDEIAAAISFLLQNHDAIITIGGLGPTSDDKTRFGLARALNLELAFNEQAWQWIVDMLQSKGVQVPATNRQQALLPAAAEPIFNANGTACACHLKHQRKDLFMLPGPPNECFPIFDNIILEKLAHQGYQQTRYKKSWLLFGVSESDIASQLEPLMENYPECTLGFRVHYPYLEVKLFSQDKDKINTLAREFLNLIAKRVVSENRQSASEQLVLILNHSKHKINFIDHATGGLLEQTLSNPKNFQTVKFNQQQTSDFEYTITLEGLQDYWQGVQDYSRMPLTITVRHAGKDKTLEKTVPNRGIKTLYYAVEIISLELLPLLKT